MPEAKPQPEDKGDVEANGTQGNFRLTSVDEYVLSDIEKQFLLAAEKGDASTVTRIIEDYRDKSEEFSIDCVDPLNRSALISAIENENYDMIILLLEAGIKVKDALLHAISEEYVEAVEELLFWEESHHVEGQPYSWEAADLGKSNFTSDITPLILAAHRNNYEILKVLLDRGATLPMPHDVKCGCDECVNSQESDSLRHSQSRINAFKALSSSSLICLSSRDPVLTAFELSWELKRLQRMETEFRAEYSEMRQLVQEFSTSLLDHARTSNELEVMLNYDHEAEMDIWEPGDRQTLSRLKLAIKYKQKMFVAHPSVQQLLAAIWYEGLPGFRRKTMPQQLIEVAKLGCMFPVYSSNYLIAPNSDMGKFTKKPFVKFILHSASYAFFLMLLGAASQRVEHLALQFIGLPWMLEILEYWKKHERGQFFGPIECFIVIYIGGLIFAEIKNLYEDGLMEYITDLWNIVDFISNMFYVTWILTRVTGFIVVYRDFHYRGLNPWFPREHWHPFDPMLIAEGAFAAGMIFSFLKLVHIFSINPHLGPLQVSLGRMIIDIIKFFFIYTLVLFAFGCGLNQLLWYYADLEKDKCYHLHPDVADFDEQEKACTIWRRFANLFETSQSLFWASFGLVDLVSFDLAGIKGFTRFWALLMFGSYSVINIIVLLNMLIAMMSNSYQIISERADIEWKFARSQLWISYFDDGGTVPPPFNLCPSVKLLQKINRKPKRTRSGIRKGKEKALALYDKVMHLLVRRYVTAEQKNRDDFTITEDDIIEVRADISTLRFELLDIFSKNNMSVPDIDKKQKAGTKKGKVMERRILKDFQIGIVEGIKSELNETSTTDVFGTIAKVIGKKQSLKGREPSSKKEWNAIVRKNTMSSNPIGSTQASMVRRSQRSLRRKMVEDANEKLNTEKLLEYNPKLGDVTATTRVAYVKFMAKTLDKRGFDFKLENEKDPNAPSDSAKTKSASVKVKSALTASAKKREQETKEPAAGPSGAAKKKDDAPPPPGSAAQKSQSPEAPGKPEAKDKSESASKPAAPAPAADSSKGKAPSAPGPAPAPAQPKKDDTAKPPPPDVPAKTAAGDSKSTDQKDQKTDEKKEEKKEEKKDEKKADEKKPDEKKPDENKPNEAKPDEKKPDDKKPGDKKDNKKPPAKPAPKQEDLGQSSAAAGGDRGKSTVTGRMISGWL